MNRFLGVVVFCSIAAACAQANPPSFTGLGHIGYPHAEAHAVSADGTVVACRAWANSNNGIPARWTAGTGLQRLCTVGSGCYGGQALGASADGSFMVGHEGDTAFYWTESIGMVDLPFLPGGGQNHAFAVAANTLCVVGGSDATTGYAACRWTSDGAAWHAERLSGSLAGIHDRAFAASSDGSVIVGGSGDSASRAFRWTAQTGIVGLPDLAGGTAQSSAQSVSGDGQVVVGWASSGNGTEACRWTFDGSNWIATGLGILPGSSWSQALGVSADGSIIVGESAGGNGGAFLWTAQRGMRDLEAVLIEDYGLGSALQGWILGPARGISADGRTIVGPGSNPAGQGEGWIAHLGDFCPGDLNADSRVSLSDLTILLSGFGCIGSGCVGDINGDESTNLADLTILLAEFGTTCP